MDTTPLVMAAYLVPVIALGLCASAGLAIFFAMRRGVASGRHGLRRVVLLAGVVFALLPWEDSNAEEAAARGSCFPLCDNLTLDEEIALWVDEIVKKSGENNSPVTREKVAAALFDDFLSLHDLMSWACISEIDAVRISWRLNAMHHEINRRYGQDNGPAIQMLYTKSIIVYGLFNPDGRGKMIYELDKKLQFFPGKRDYYTEAEAVAAVATIYDAIGQHFGPVSDYAVALYLTERGKRLGNWRHYRLAFVFFDEVVRRFNKDERSEIRLLVQDAIKLRARYKARLSPQ